MKDEKRDPEVKEETSAETTVSQKPEAQPQGGGMKIRSRIKAGSSQASPTYYD